MTELTVRKETSTDPQEVGTLARKLADCYCSTVDFYHKKMNLPLPEAVSRAEERNSPEHVQRVLEGPADQVHWLDLNDLARSNPELALRRWEEVNQEALDELQSGHRAAKAVEGFGADPWQRAQFLAIRAELAEGLQPRNGIERQLIDQMAQAQTSMFYWQAQLNLRLSVEPMSEKRIREEGGGWMPKRVSEHQELEQEAAMVDRFNKMFLRTLRTLCDMRKGPLAVVFQNAGQVNIGQQQVNMATEQVNQ